jgi:hypothetical protein
MRRSRKNRRANTSSPRRKFPSVDEEYLQRFSPLSGGRFNNNITNNRNNKNNQEESKISVNGEELIVHHTNSTQSIPSTPTNNNIPPNAIMIHNSPTNAIAGNLKSLKISKSPAKNASSDKAVLPKDLVDAKWYDYSMYQEVTTFEGSDRYKKWIKRSNTLNAQNSTSTDTTTADNNQHFQQMNTKICGNCESIYVLPYEANEANESNDRDESKTNTKKKNCRLKYRSFEHLCELCYNDSYKAWQDTEIENAKNSMGEKLSSKKRKKEEEELKEENAQLIETKDDIVLHINEKNEEGYDDENIQFQKYYDNDSKTTMTSYSEEKWSASSICWPDVAQMKKCGGQSSEYVWSEESVNQPIFRARKINILAGPIITFNKNEEEKRYAWMNEIGEESLATDWYKEELDEYSMTWKCNPWNNYEEHALQNYRQASLNYDGEYIDVLHSEKGPIGWYNYKEKLIELQQYRYALLQQCKQNGSAIKRYDEYGDEVWYINGQRADTILTNEYIQKHIQKRKRNSSHLTISLNGTGGRNPDLFQLFNEEDEKNALIQSYVNDDDNGGDWNDDYNFFPNGNSTTWGGATKNITDIPLTTGLPGDNDQYSDHDLDLNTRFHNNNNNNNIMPPLKPIETTVPLIVSKINGGDDDISSGSRGRNKYGVTPWMVTDNQKKMRQRRKQERKMNQNAWKNKQLLYTRNTSKKQENLTKAQRLKQLKLRKCFHILKKYLILKLRKYFHILKKYLIHQQRNAERIEREERGKQEQLFSERNEQRQQLQQELIKREEKEKEERQRQRLRDREEQNKIRERIEHERNEQTRLAREKKHLEKLQKEEERQRNEKKQYAQSGTKTARATMSTTTTTTTKMTAPGEQLEWKMIVKRANNIRDKNVQDTKKAWYTIVRDIVRNKEVNKKNSPKSLLKEKYDLLHKIGYFEKDAKIKKNASDSDAEKAENDWWRLLNDCSKYDGDILKCNNDVKAYCQTTKSTEGFDKFLELRVKCTQEIDRLWSENEQEKQLLHQYHKFILLRQLFGTLDDGEDDDIDVGWIEAVVKPRFYIGQIIVEWSVHQNKTKDDQFLEWLIFGELLAQCPELKLFPPDKNEIHKSRFDDLNYWVTTCKSLAKKDVKDYLARCKERANNIRNKTLLYLCIMSSEVMSKHNIVNGKKVGDIENPFSKHLFRFCVAVTSAPNIQLNDDFKIKNDFKEQLKTAIDKRKKEFPKKANDYDLLYKKLEDSSFEEPSGEALAYNIFGNVWPCGVVYPSKLHINTIKGIKYPWLCSMISLIMKHSAKKLITRYGIQGYKMIDALKKKFCYIVKNCEIFNLRVERIQKNRIVKKPNYDFITEIYENDMEWFNEKDDEKKGVWYNEAFRRIYGDAIFYEYAGRISQYPEDKGIFMKIAKEERAGQLRLEREQRDEEGFLSKFLFECIKTHESLSDTLKQESKQNM